MIELWPEQRSEDLQWVKEGMPMVATVTGGKGGSVRWFVDGEEVQDDPVDSDNFQARWSSSRDDGRVRVELWMDDTPRVITGVWWIDHASIEKEGPCGCGNGGEAAIWLGGLAAVFRRLARRPATA